ncbi:MAG: DUF2764 family protein [Fulvivirga sp.]|nr:DUF2764 family protein [Fulvivirga sp.]
MDSKLLHIGEITDLIERNLTPEDLKIYRCLLFQNDNRNLLHLIFHEYHGLSYERLHYPAIIPIKTLKSYKRKATDLPDYMVEFLQDNAGVFSTYSPKDIELKLRAYFLDFVRKQQSKFLQHYYEWQYQLESVLAEINQRNYTFLKEEENDDLDYLGMVPPGLSLIDKSLIIGDLTPLIEAQNYSDIEQKTDEYYWDFADHWRTPFSAEAVFAYTIRLLRIARWSTIPSDSDKSQAQFESIINSLKSKHLKQSKV